MLVLTAGNRLFFQLRRVPQLINGHARREVVGRGRFNPSIVFPLSNETSR